MINRRLTALEMQQATRCSLADPTDPTGLGPVPVQVPAMAEVDRLHLDRVVEAAIPNAVDSGVVAPMADHAALRRTVAAATWGQ